MARRITLACLGFILMLSLFSASCWAVQSDTDPVFPKSLQEALLNRSAPLGRVTSQRAPYQPQRSVRTERDLLSQAHNGVGEQANYPPSDKDRLAVPRVANLLEHLNPNQSNQNIKVNSIPNYDVTTESELAESELIDDWIGKPDRKTVDNVPSQKTDVGSVLAAGEPIETPAIGIDSAAATKYALESVSDGDAESEFGTVMTFPDGESSLPAKIVVHPPTSSSDNEFSFNIENTGDIKSQPFLVEFETPNDISIIQVFPFHAKTTRNHVEVAFDGLDAGGSRPVHIKTTASNQGAFSFQTRIRMDQVHAFQVETEESILPSITRPEESIPMQFASTGDKSKGATHRLTDSLDSKQHQSVQATSDRKDPDLPADDVALSTSLTGSELLVEGREHEFEILIDNRSSQTATEIIVQLSLPGGLMVTKLDREAWIDQHHRTVSWKIESIGPGQTKTIVYRVQAVGTEDQIQKIVVGMRNTYQGQVDFGSRVMAQPAEQPSQPAFEE